MFNKSLFASERKWSRWADRESHRLPTNKVMLIHVFQTFSANLVKNIHTHFYYALVLYKWKLLHWLSDMTLCIYFSDWKSFHFGLWDLYRSLIYSMWFFLNTERNGPERLQFCLNENGSGRLVASLANTRNFDKSCIPISFRSWCVCHIMFWSVNNMAK